MAFSDKAAAIHYLSHINYYRLGAYWLPFEADHTSHQFQVGTTFEQVLNLYIFDRELRLLVLDAIERIEISVRTQWAYHCSHRHGAHALLDRTLFKDKWNYTENANKLKQEVSANQETFIKHLRTKYDEPLPPIWAAVEIMTLGQLSKWFGNQKHGSDRNVVAHVYDLDETNLTSFLHHLSTVRNLCAHHSRLWNREFTFAYKLPQQRPRNVVISLNRQKPKNIYNTLVMLEYMMNRISPDHHWKQRLLNLIANHKIDSKSMGFPTSWQTLVVWK